MDQVGDGNALAGPLAEVFAVDLTAARARCGACGATGPVTALRVYGQPPALVARCPGCEEVVLRVNRSPGAVWLDLRGAASLRIDLADQGLPDRDPPHQDPPHQDPPRQDPPG
ncbi:DUF6510 family protein [Saccharothrix sp. Mg75]|uniref:DUF6510 family protein n=1 Tax=Saccharothrix sp. Mg75 TaxID=3445357 RepID=UPI003EEB59E1